MSTLYLRLPSKAATGNTPHWPARPCPFALASHSNVSHDASITRQGLMPLQDLSDTIAKAQRIVVMLAASDVTLLRLKVPALSPSRLKAALPYLVENQLITDPSDCVVVAGGLADGLHTVAVAQRTWLEALAKTLIDLGARQIAVMPAQLCLPCQPDQPGQSGSVAVAVVEHGNAIDVTLRLSEYDGIGLAVSADGHKSATHEIIRTLCAIVPEASIALYVPQSGMHEFQDVINDAGALNKRISVLVDSWPRWISGAKSTTLDLMTGLSVGTSPKVDWRAWRWPLALAAAVLVINVAALNIDWWHMKNEASALRATMTQIYKSSFPKEPVIIDPVAQMRQKIAAIKHDAGLASPDDFTVIASTFGEALASVAAASGKLPAIAALEYRERSLFVRFKPNAEVPMQQMKITLAERNLSLEQETSGVATVWKIRSAK